MMRSVLAVAIGTFLAFTVVQAADVGVPAAKLVVVDTKNGTVAGKASYVARNHPGLQKGIAGDPSQLNGTFEFRCNQHGPFSSPYGAFVMPPTMWLTNTETVAKYLNRDPAVPTSVRLAVIKPGALAKVVAKETSDGPPPELDDCGPDITTILTIQNGNDGSTHRMCTRFAEDVGSTVIVDAGAQKRDKIVAKNGVPTACP